MIGLWRRREDGPEQRFLLDQPEIAFGLTWIAKAEFLCGSIVSGHDAEIVSGFLDLYQVVWPSETTIMHYAQIYAHPAQPAADRPK